jgi:hypothetical protein
MSRETSASIAVPTLQPATESASGDTIASGADLHPRLRVQLESLGRAPNAAVTLNALLPVISSQYEQIDEERRGVVRSMQLLAEEARAFSQGWRTRMPGGCAPSSITSRTSS